MKKNHENIKRKEIKRGVFLESSSPLNWHNRMFVDKKTILYSLQWYLKDPSHLTLIAVNAPHTDSFYDEKLLIEKYDKKNKILYLKKIREMYPSEEDLYRETYSYYMLKII